MVYESVRLEKQRGVAHYSQNGFNIHPCVGQKRYGGAIQMTQSQSALTADGLIEENKREPLGVKQPDFWKRAKSDLQVRVKRKCSSLNMTRPDLHSEGKHR